MSGFNFKCEGNHEEALVQFEKGLQQNSLNNMLLTIRDETVAILKGFLIYIYFYLLF